MSHLQRTISCVTPSILRVPSGYGRLGERIDLALASGEPVRLRGPERIHLRVRLRVRVAQDEPPRGLWDAQTVAYEYRLSDQDDREILAYHWHPESQSHARMPHLHLGPAAEVGRPALLAAHLPTGQIALHDVVRLAVESFGVAPVRGDWDHVLSV